MGQLGMIVVIYNLYDNKKHCDRGSNIQQVAVDYVFVENLTFGVESAGEMFI